MTKTTQNAPTHTSEEPMRNRIPELNPRRIRVTPILTILAAAAFAIGATTALAATGRSPEAETSALVRKHQPKLERKDRWERKATTFDSMWRQRR